MMAAATGNATNVGAEVKMSIARDPALVRTVRLVAAAVARRADCADALVEEIRLAVGEACAVMIGLDETGKESREQVDVQLSTTEGFRVTVTGRMDTDDSGFGDIGLDPWALLRGISEDLQVSEEGGVTTLQMTWPS
jgi:anti-sigma regulatory factor (Ser/Thr protein kinase)